MKIFHFSALPLQICKRKIFVTFLMFPAKIDNQFFFYTSEAVKQYFRSKKRDYQDSLKSPNTQVAIKSRRNGCTKRNRVNMS